MICLQDIYQRYPLWYTFTCQVKLQIEIFQLPFVLFQVVSNKPDGTYSVNMVPVNIININDNAPEFNNKLTACEIQISESTAVGELISLKKCQAVDSDGKYY